MSRQGMKSVAAYMAKITQNSFELKWVKNEGLFGKGSFVDEQTEGQCDLPLALTWSAAADDTIS